MTRTSLSFLCAAPLLALLGCGNGGGSTHVTGQTHGNVDGTSTHAARVRAWHYDDAGQPQTLDEGDVAADGSWELDLDADIRAVVITALDADDAPVGEVLLASTGDGSATVTTAPMDRETAFEAAVFEALVAGGGKAADVDFADLRARVTADVALAANSADDAGKLGVALQAAQQARFDSLSAANLNVQAILDAEDAALADYDADGSASLDALFDIPTDAEADEGASPQVSWEAAAQADISASALVGALYEDAYGAADGFVLAGNRLEATAAGNAAVDAASASGNATSEDIAVNAAARLEAALDAAQSASDVATAWGTFSADLVGGFGSDDSALDVIVGISLDVIVSDAADSAASLAAAVDMSVHAIAQDDRAADETAALVEDGWANFSGTVRAAVDAATIGLGNGDATADLVLVATGSGLMAR